MANYFKFKTTADIEAKSRELGLDLRFSDDLSPLFKPVRIGPLTAGNAMCIQPMEGCDCKLDGTPDELTLRRYVRFGAGGAKIIWGEACAVVEEGRANSRQLAINENTLPVVEKMLVDCKKAHREACGTDADLVVGLQLTHSGRYSYKKPLITVRDPILDSRIVVNKTTGETIGPDYPVLTDDYLKGLVAHYVKAAKLAYKVGFQFVDIKQCHRYLLSELLASKTRPGPYGGSLENRTRLARDIFTAIKAEVPGLVLATRMNVFDCIPYVKPPGDDAAGKPSPWKVPVKTAFGTCEDDPFKPDLTEPKAWIGEMAKLGVAMVNVSMGNPYATMHVIRPFEYPPPDAYETPEHPLIGVDRHFRLAAELQQAYPQLPIVGSGYSYLQDFIFSAGAANIRDGRIRIVGVGRASLPQPDFALQIQKNGKLDRKRICRTFSYCTAMMRAKNNELGQYPTGCPPFDKEVYMPVWDEIRGK